MNSRRKRKGKKMSAKNQKAVVEVKEVKRSKGAVDYCYACTLDAPNGSKEAREALNCSPKKALEELKKLAPKIENRKRALWNRVQAQIGNSPVEYWECVECGRISESAKNVLSPDEKDLLRLQAWKLKK